MVEFISERCRDMISKAVETMALIIEDADARRKEQIEDGVPKAVARAQTVIGHVICPSCGSVVDYRHGGPRALTFKCRGESCGIGGLS